MFNENNAKEVLREFAYRLNDMAGEFEEGVEIEEADEIMLSIISRHSESHAANVEYIIGVCEEMLTGGAADDGLHQEFLDMAVEFACKLSRHSGAAYIRVIEKELEKTAKCKQDYMNETIEGLGELKDFYMGNREGLRKLLEIGQEGNSCIMVTNDNINLVISCLCADTAEEGELLYPCRYASAINRMILSVQPDADIAHEFYLLLEEEKRYKGKESLSPFAVAIDEYTAETVTRIDRDRRFAAEVVRTAVRELAEHMCLPVDMPEGVIPDYSDLEKGFDNMLRNIASKYEIEQHKAARTFFNAFNFTNFGDNLAPDYQDFVEAVKICA